MIRPDVESIDYIVPTQRDVYEQHVEIALQNAPLWGYTAAEVANLLPEQIEALATTPPPDQHTAKL